jgi:hypothetical protein
VPPVGIRPLDAHVAVAWVSHPAEARLSRDAREATRAMIEHDRVVGGALAQGVTPIPASLADPYDDDDALLRDLSDHEREIAMAFPLIADKVEMTTIVALQDSPPAPDVSSRGTAYLEQIRSAPIRVAEIAGRIADSLEPRFAVSHRRSADGRFAISHLLAPDAIESYRTIALASSGKGYRVVIDGPRAPYSFCLFAPHRGIVGTILAT